MKPARITAPVSPAKNAPKYPWRTMQINEAFFVGIDEDGAGTIRNQASAAGTRTKRRFAVRTVRSDDRREILGYRVQRLK